MKKSLVVAAVGLTAAAVLGPLDAVRASPIHSAPTARTATSAPCTPSTSKQRAGVKTLNYCGPATATLSIDGKTYTFKNGYCQSLHVSSIALDVTLGTLATARNGRSAAGNAGKPYFALDLEAQHLPSNLTNTFFGGKQLSSGGSVTYRGGLTSHGTFKSSFTPSGKSFSGSWNCHGIFVKH